MAGIFSVMLPWIVQPRGNLIGLSQPDGLLTLIGGGVALALAWRRIPSGWILTAFIAVLLGRDFVNLLRLPSARPGVGLWIAVASFVAAAVVQFADLVRSRLGARKSA